MRWPVGWFGLAGLPVGQRQEVALAVARRAGGRIQDGLVGFAGADGVGHGVVDFENDSLGAVLAVGFLVLAFDDRESLHDVIDGVTGCGKIREQFSEALLFPFFS